MTPHHPMPAPIHPSFSNQPQPLQHDPLLHHFAPALQERSRHSREHRNAFPDDLRQAADWHLHYGLHRQDDRSWRFREWLPRARTAALIGDFCAWNPDAALPLQPDGNGDWSGFFPESALAHGQHYQMLVSWEGGSGWRLPSAARRVVRTHGAAGELVFNAQVWEPEPAYSWRYPQACTPRPDFLHIYETHVGMALPAERVTSFAEFRAEMLPRIAAQGYNCLQLMAIAQHPYYASFGYHVANFYAVCDLYGTPEDFKALVDAAHACGLRVIMDLVHSHAVRNELEGLASLCGWRQQFFAPGDAGEHPAWGSYCFDYSSTQVCRFLFSNCRYWLEEYHLDGFRFDGVTSMLYHDHGLGRAFTGYHDYFSSNTNLDAWSYLKLANEVVHACRPDAWSIAEDVSGMPGLGAPAGDGGLGFDYRMAMGVADFWFRLLDRPDGSWPLAQLWHELTSRRADERCISYVESHDQALVGGRSFLQHCLNDTVYTGMAVNDRNPVADRGVALHKMARLATLGTAGHGYLTFIGNDFGHPEWIDFPRDGNAWSFQHARRRWDLCDHPQLRYHALYDFDRAMLQLSRNDRQFARQRPQMLLCDEPRQILAWARAGLVFICNFHPEASYLDWPLEIPGGNYRLALDSDAQLFSGFGRLQPGQEYISRAEVVQQVRRSQITLYLPARTALVLQRL